MIETGGVACNGRKSQAEDPTMLRFNVEDVPAASEELRQKGIGVDVQTFSWGIVGTFLDPDGNACEFKDANDPYFQ